MIFILITFAYLSFTWQVDLLTTSLGKALMVTMAVVWLIRAGTEVAFFHLGEDGAVWRVVLFVILAALYGLPVYFERVALNLSC